MTNQEKDYAVLGLGRYGRRIAEILAKTGASLMVADNDHQLVDQMASIATYAVYADLSDPSAVEDMGLDKIEVVVVDLANDLEAAITSVMVAKEQGVGMVIAKAGSHRMGNVLKKVGADRIVFPEEECAERMARTLISEDFIEYINIADDLCVNKLKPKREWVGKRLDRLNLRTKYHINLLGIERDGRYSIDFSPETIITADKPLMILTDKKYVFDYI